MTRRLRWAAPLAIVMVLALAGSALAAITWGSQTNIPQRWAWNYSNSMEFTGTPGTASFKLHEIFASDATLPQAAMYTGYEAGAWSAPVKISGADHIEGVSLATAGNTVIAGWMTWESYNNYDPADPRRFQVAISTNAGDTWSAPVNLTPANGRVDYPIVAAAVTSTGAVNLYGIWTDANTGRVQTRMKTGAGAWSSPITLGRSTADANDGEGIFGYANIGATRNLVFAAWISNNRGALKARAVNLNGVNNAAATLANWTATASLGRISMRQNGFPIAGSSPLVTNKVTMAWNTNTAQKYTTYNGTAIDTAGTVIWANGTANGRTYTGGYSTVAEPHPGGGIVAGWGACRDTALANDCNYGSGQARFDLLMSTSTNGTTFSAPALVADSAVSSQRMNDEPSIVATSGTTYVQYNGYTASYSNYDVYFVIGTGNP
jgi:hypothetical protein